MQEIGINKSKMFWVRDYRTLSPKWDVIMKLFPLKHLWGRECIQFLSARGSRQFQVKSILQTQQDHRTDWHTYELTETVTTCVRPTQSNHTNCTIQKWKQTQSSTPKQNSLQLIPAIKGRIRFLQWNVIRYINHTPRQAPCPRVVWPTENGLHVFYVCFLRHGFSV